MTDGDASHVLQAQLLCAAADNAPVAPRGSGSKDFLGRQTELTALSTLEHRGIVSYQPTELTITARCGTPLSELNEALAEHAQCLAFEPPHFGAGATLGGTIAAGLSGPARAYAGAARDFVLGTRILNGKGERLRFGGEVMKNVAGYDVSRLMTGAMGTLGILLDVSIKVLPLAQCTATRVFEMTATDAIRTMNLWGAQPLPITATAHQDNRLHVRLAGSKSGVNAALERLGGEPVADGDTLWRGLREHRLGFFDSRASLWRVSVPSLSPTLASPGEWIMEWGGALRWLASDADADSIRSVVRSAGGHATLYRGADRSGDVFHPLDPLLLKLHQRLKHAFDPKGLLNPGRMYPDF